MTRNRLLFVFLVVVLCLPAFAQEASESTTQTEASVDEDYVAVPEPTEEAMRYYYTGMAWYAFDTLWGLFLPALILFTGFSARIRDAAQRIGRKWFFTIFFYVILFSVITFILSLPFAYLEGFRRPHAYGLSNQTLDHWMRDTLIIFATSTLITAFVMWVPYLLLKKAPQRWWLITGILALPFLITIIWLKPIAFDPVLDDFGPMTDKDLESKILTLADRAGIESGDVYEVNKSEDTNTVNAYVAGFGDTQRIVLWDTLLNKLEVEQTLFVMGHEMGHYVLGHVWRTIVLVSVALVLALYAAHRTMGGLLRRFKHRFGFSELHDIASLPLLAIVVSVFTFILQPVLLAHSRHIEHEADRFGLELTQANHAAASAFVKLQSENLGNPWPHTFYTYLRYSHPPLGTRIEFCNTYRPWETDTPLEYGHIIKNAAE